MFVLLYKDVPFQTVQVLLEHGANINKANHAGFTALHFACKQGQRDIIPPLLEYGAHHLSNKNGDTPMSLSFMVGFDWFLPS